MSLSLSLLVPGLFGPSPGGRGAGRTGALAAIREGIDLSEFERSLSRAEQIADASCDGALEGMLCRCLGLVQPAGGDWPIGPITRRFDGGEVDTRWHLRADPVFVRPDLQKVTLVDASRFPIAPAQAAALADEINRHFEPEPWRVEAPHPSRWYLSCETDPQILTVPLSLAAGGSVEDFLPAGERAPYWRQILNEIQMLLHSSAVNREREEHGEVPINSLWLWGAGRSPVSPAPRWSQVWTDSELATALAHFCAAPSSELPSGLVDLVGTTPRSGEELVVIDRLYAPSRHRDIETWRDEISLLYGSWLEPMRAALADHRLDAVTVSVGAQRSFRIDRAGLRRWWRRRRRFETLAGASV